MKEVVKILWTGGWDSTYRMVELSQKDVIVQPIYCIDKRRKSYEIEISRMNIILDKLRKHPKTLATIEEITFIKRSDIPYNKTVLDAYEIVHRNAPLGSQYGWLAQLAKVYGPVEICIEKPSGGHFTQTVEKYGSIIEKDDTWVVDKEQSSFEFITLFENVLFPVYGIDEVEMAENIRKWGYEDVMQQIWFCHNPIAGQPCGFCVPCAGKMTSDMEWLLPEDARKRYYLWEKLKGLFGQRIGNKIMRVLFC